MSSGAIVPALVDTIDSYYQHILNAMQALNPARGFGGIIEARDWPARQDEFEVLYLIIPKEGPTRSPHQSFYQILMTFNLYWAWNIQGSNIPQNAQAANRGNRYRTKMQMIQELLSAHNPGYCSKFQYAVTADASNQPQYVVSPYDDPDYLWWGIPNFTDKTDRESGILFCQGNVAVSSYSPITVPS